MVQCNNNLQHGFSFCCCKSQHSTTFLHFNSGTVSWHSAEVICVAFTEIYLIFSHNLLFCPRVHSLRHLLSPMLILATKSQFSSCLFQLIQLILLSIAPSKAFPCWIYRWLLLSYARHHTSSFHILSIMLLMNKFHLQRASSYRSSLCSWMFASTACFFWPSLASLLITPGFSRILNLNTQRALMLPSRISHESS